MAWGKTEFIIVAVLGTLIVAIASVACSSQKTAPTATRVPTVSPTRSGEEIVATAQARRTATTEAVKRDLQECEDIAETADRITAATSGSLGTHSASVSLPSLEVVSSTTGSTNTRSSTSPDAYRVLVDECLSFLAINADDYPHLHLVKQALAKAQAVVMSTVAPMITATAESHATAVANNATVRSRGVVFECERLRLAQREASIFPEVVYQHVSNVMQNAPQAKGIYFDSYDAKIALEQCP